MITADEETFYKIPTLYKKGVIVNLNPPNLNEVQKIIKCIYQKYEDYYKVKVLSIAIKKVIKLSEKYIGSHSFPAKAIEVLDDVCALVFQKKLHQAKQEKRLRQTNLLVNDNKILSHRSFLFQKLQREVFNTALCFINFANHDFEVQLPTNSKSILAVLVFRWYQSKHHFEWIARKVKLTFTLGNIRKEKVKTNTKTLIKEKESVNQQFNEPSTVYQDKNKKPNVKSTDIGEIISELTKIPLTLFTKKDSERLLILEKTLHNRVIGQNEAVEVVAKAVRRARAGLNSPNRPIAVFFFAGTTGVGKTELAKALAEQYFGTKESILRFDMSEYQSRGVSRLIGADPGYIGYQEGGLLTNKIKENPSSLVLFDEFEKSDNGIFDLMLQLFDEGRLTDSRGSTVSFSEAIIILTSNAGAVKINKLVNETNLKNKTPPTYEILIDKVNKALKSRFRPEFLNRIDEITVFRPLTKIEISEISDIILGKFKKKLKKKDNIELSVSQSAKDLIIKKGYDPQYGARPLRRAFTNFLENAIITKLQNEENDFNSFGKINLFADLDPCRNITIQKLI